MRPLQQSPTSQQSPSFPLLLFTLFATATLATACGSGNGTATPHFSGNTQVSLVLTSTANDQLSQFSFGFTSITLTSPSGTTVSLLSEPQNTSLGAELIHVNGEIDPLITVSVPQGIYTAATMQIMGGADFTCVTLTPPDSQGQQSLDTSTYAYGYVPNNMVSVSLPSPITVTGNSMGLLLDLQASQSATYSSCYSAGIQPWSITPTFTLTALPFSLRPTGPNNGKVSGLNGQVSSIGTGNSFTLALTEGPRNLAISSSSSTIYQGVSDFSALAPGTFVNMDGAIQSDGSLLATRIAVEDPSAVDVQSGPAMLIGGDPSNGEASAWVFNRQSQGPDQIPLTWAYNVSAATFQISDELNNLQSLPFVPAFSASNLVAGQNVYVSTLAFFNAGDPYTLAHTVTLVPQTINGTVVGSSTSSSFTDYTISLASYDLFPTLAVQQGQTTLLTNPDIVEVYVDSNTRMLNKQPLAAGNTMRFYGLVFNDNGTLRMDCAQVHDGVAFNPPSNSTAQMASGQVQTIRRKAVGGSRVINTITRWH